MAVSISFMIATSIYIYGKAFIYGCVVVGVLLYRQLTSPTRWLFRVKRRDAPPSCLLDENLGQHGYVTVKGLKFHYVEKGDKSKPLMLFVHGWPEFWYSWRHQMKEFSKDYWTVAVDMRGYGGSAKPPKVSDYYLPLLVDDIKGIVTELGREKFTLVAHDWGAVISWTFVDVYPEMVEKYIMMNGPHNKVFSSMLLSSSSSQNSKSWYIFLFQLPFVPEMYMRFNDLAMLSQVFLAPKKSNPYVTKDDIEAFKYTFSKPENCVFPLNYYRAALRTKITQGLTPKTRAKKIPKGTRPPGLYIFGAKDIAIDIDNVSKHKELFENLETIIIKEGNHFVQQDEPKAVNDAMRSFLK